MDQEYIDNLKREYNKTLLRHIKAFIYLEDNNIPMNKREEWLPEFQKIIDNLNRILNTLEVYEVKIKTQNVLSGFPVD